jgi:hypothetical protein
MSWRKAGDGRGLSANAVEERSSEGSVEVGMPTGLSDDTGAEGTCSDKGEPVE